MQSRLATIAACLALVVAACGGGSDEPEAPPSTPAPPASTTPAPTTTGAPLPPPTTQAPPPPTTEAPPAPTTTSTAPLPDGGELLAAMNAVMAEHPTFIGAVQAYVKENEDTPNEDAILTNLAVGGSSVSADFWGLTLVEIDTPSLTQSFFIQARTVGGIDYDQDVSTGVWGIDEDEEPDPVDDASVGMLSLENISVERSASGYTVTGSYAADPSVDSVSVDIDAATSRLRRVTVLGRIPRSEFTGLVEAEGDDLVLVTQVDVTAYDIEMPALVAPPVGVATMIVPDTESAFLTSVPSDWVPLTNQELAESGVTSGFKGPRGLTLLILVEDLTGTGITSLGGYADALASLVFADTDLSFFDATKTLQGRDAWLISGHDPVRNFDFRRLVYLTPQGIGINLTFAQGPDPATDQPTTAWGESQDLVDFMINSFLLNS